MINHPEFMKIYDNFDKKTYFLVTNFFIKNEKKIFIFKSNKGSI